MDKQRQPGISFDNIILKELVFFRKPETLKSPNVSINFETGVSISPDKDKLDIEMLCEIKEEKELFNIKCAMIGMFSRVAGSENMELDEFARFSGPALMLPYIRETIASTTLKAGIAPVIIPPVNLQAIGETWPSGQARA
jgi:preprotein translocase subunit SecB